MSDHVSVSAAELVRNFGHWQAKALQAPVGITHHGRERLVLASVDYYWDAVSKSPAEPDEGAEAELATKLSAVLDNLDQGFMELKRDLRISRVNHVVEAFLCQTRAQVEGRVLTDLSPTLADSTLVAQIRRVLRTGEEAQFETNSLGFQGRFLGFRVFPYPDGVALLFTNLTDREKTNDAVQDWAACKAALCGHPAIALASVDGRGRFTFVDKIFQELTGFGERELASCRLFDIVANSDRRLVQKVFEELLRTRTPIDLMVRFAVRNLEERVFHVSFGPIVRAFAECGAYMVATDVRPLTPAASNENLSR